MKNTALIVLVFGLVCLVNPARVLAQEFNVHSPVTLYSTSNIAMNIATFV